MSSQSVDDDVVHISFHVEEDEPQQQQPAQTAAAPPASSSSAASPADSSPAPDVDPQATGHGYFPSAIVQPLEPAPAQAQSEIELQETKTEQPEEKKELKRAPSTAGDPNAEEVWLVSTPALVDRFGAGLELSAPKSSKGLTSEEAAARLLKNGRNELTPPKDRPEWLKYLLQYTDPFMLLLTLAGILSAAVAYSVDTTQPMNLYIGIVLWVVVFISCTFSYVQEGKASSVMKSFKSMLPAKARVLRDGTVVDIPAAEIVVGDLVRVGGGDQVPADMRVVWTQDCKVETSSLTGESLPISLTLHSKEPKIEQARNIMFNTSKCLEGDAIGLVFATGDNTLIGNIAKLTTVTKSEDTTLQKEIKHFVKRLTIFAVCLGIVFFIIGIARGQDWIFAFINGFIVVMIANVPEGLPMTVVSCLTITARRLAALNVFVKQLQCVETLGSATVIATDKTGTLTQNKMSVSRLWFDTLPMNVETALRDMPAHTTRKKKDEAPHPGHTLEHLELIAAICSRTRFEDERQLTAEEAAEYESASLLRQLDPTMTLRSAKAAFPTLLWRVDPNLTLNSARTKFLSSLGGTMRDDSTRNVIGDASETALFNFVRMRQSIELLRYHHPIVFDQPFNSRNKYALCISKPFKLDHIDPNQRTLMMKGAPEVILARCSHYMSRGRPVPIDDDFRSSFQLAYETFAGFGERVLGFAELILDPAQFPPSMDSKYSIEAQNFPTSGLVFVGVISLVDPPKLSVPAAIQDCRTAGIKVIMVTGDHPLTAAAIARQVGIISSNTRDEIAKIKRCPPEDVAEEEVDAIVIKGTDIDGFTEADWTRVLSKSEIVFARTTPQQKLLIVEHCQNMGEIVAATGDGVNDSPALKKADIGVAMGISGSDVARDAAAVILMDDDFASIVVGVREGRTIFDNLTKTIAYTLTHMIPEVTPILLNLAFGFPLGLSAILILTIDLGTELAPGISMAYEPAEANVMQRPPRNANTDRLVTKQVVSYALLQAGVIEALNCFMVFFLVFDYYGIKSNDLFNTKSFQTKSDPLIYNGVLYSTTDQENILAEAQTAFWAMLCFAQVFHIWMCKTRVVSMFSHGVTRNEFTLFGVAIEICLILLIIYPPSSHTIFGTRGFPDRYWGFIVVAPFVLLVWNELRKWISRKYPKGWVAKHLNW